MNRRVVYVWELEERRTREAYARWPDSAADAYLDPAAWEANEPRTRAKRPRRR